MIYFIRDPEADRVKIGTSKNPWARMQSLQVGSHARLVLEAIVDGEKAQERALHAEFAHRHVNGEWFVWSGDIARHVASLDAVLNTVPQPSRRSKVTTEVTQAIVTMGFVRTYACHFLNGHRPWPFGIAVGVWRLSGHKVGPLADATDAEMRVLAKYADAFSDAKANLPQKAA